MKLIQFYWLNQRCVLLHECSPAADSQNQSIVHYRLCGWCELLVHETSKEEKVSSVPANLNSTPSMAMKEG